jgi:hypothetical protein
LGVELIEVLHAGKLDQASCNKEKRRKDYGALHDITSLGQHVSPAEK